MENCAPGARVPVSTARRISAVTRSTAELFADATDRTCPCNTIGSPQKFWSHTVTPNTVERWRCDLQSLRYRIYLAAMKERVMDVRERRRSGGVDLDVLTAIEHKV